MTSEWTICITAMPAEEALDIAARIADAEEPDCEDLLLTEGPRVCDVLRCEVLHQAEVIERRTAELSTTTGEIARLRAALVEAREIIEGRTVAPTDEEIIAHHAALGWWTFGGLPVALFFRDGVFHLIDDDPADVMSGDAARGWIADRSAWPNSTWRAHDNSGRPCAWPAAEAPHG